MILFCCGWVDQGQSIATTTNTAGKPNPSGLCHLRLKAVTAANADATYIPNLRSNVRRGWLRVSAMVALVQKQLAFLINVSKNATPGTGCVYLGLIVQQCSVRTEGNVALQVSS